MQNVLVSEELWEREYTAHQSGNLCHRLRKMGEQRTNPYDIMKIADYKMLLGSFPPRYSKIPNPNLARNKGNTLSLFLLIFFIYLLKPNNVSNKKLLQVNKFINYEIHYFVNPSKRNFKEKIFENMY